MKKFILAFLLSVNLFANDKVGFGVLEYPTKIGVNVFQCVLVVADNELINQYQSDILLCIKEDSDVFEQDEYNLSLMHAYFGNNHKTEIVSFLSMDNYIIGLLKDPVPFPAAVLDTEYSGNLEGFGVGCGDQETETLNQMSTYVTNEKILIGADGSYIVTANENFMRACYATLKLSPFRCNAGYLWNVATGKRISPKTFSIGNDRRIITLNKHILSVDCDIINSVAEKNIRHAVLGAISKLKSINKGELIQDLDRKRNSVLRWNGQIPYNSTIERLQDYEKAWRQIYAPIVATGILGPLVPFLYKRFLSKPAKPTMSQLARRGIGDYVAKKAQQIAETVFDETNRRVRRSYFAEEGVGVEEVKEEFDERAPAQANKAPNNAERQRKYEELSLEQKNLLESFKAGDQKKYETQITRLNNLKGRIKGTLERDKFEELEAEWNGIIAEIEKNLQGSKGTMPRRSKTTREPRKQPRVYDFPNRPQMTEGAQRDLEAFQGDARTQLGKKIEEIMDGVYATTPIQGTNGRMVEVHAGVYRIYMVDNLIVGISDKDGQEDMIDRLKKDL